MSQTPRMFDMAQALYKTFALPTPVLYSARGSLSRTDSAWSRVHPHCKKTFCTSTPRFAKPSAASSRRTQLFDEEIKARKVRVINWNGDSMSDLVTPSRVLATIDRKEKKLVQITYDDLKDTQTVPLCKIVDKKELFEMEKRKKAHERAQRKSGRSANSTKQLELNWAIGASDLSHRLDKMREFLREGRKVEIFLASKKGGRRATPEECDNLLAQLRNAAGSIEGAFVQQEFRGKPGQFATIVFKGRTAEDSQAGQDEHAGEVAESRDVA